LSHTHEPAAISFSPGWKKRGWLGGFYPYKQKEGEKDPLHLDRALVDMTRCCIRKTFATPASKKKEVFVLFLRGRGGKNEASPLKRRRYNSADT